MRGHFFQAARDFESAMKYFVTAAVVFLGCVLVLGPTAGAFELPAGVASVLDDLGSIF